MNKLTYITLFSSAGIGCYGFKMNDYECVATVELLPQRLGIQKANKKCKYESGYINGDITSTDTHTRLFEEINMWKDNEGLEQVDVVFATPPCQGMSSANSFKKDEDKVRNSLVTQAIKLIMEICPKVFVLENVRAFMKTICTDLDGTDRPIKDSIFGNLGEKYNIHYDVINFKDYGVPSSRPRTIVIGVSKEYGISPESLFPIKQNEITLRESIGDLPSLNYGEKDPNDFFHFARKFPIEQLEWIKYLKEGQSAFDQPLELQPGKIDENGNKIVNKCSFIKQKYRRMIWDKPGPCITTRNDILSTTNTIHPSDNRVLSIRELMRVMTIPNSFRWTDYDETITSETQDSYLKKNERNIRTCIGEAVPTEIIRSISYNIKQALTKKEED